MKRIKSLFVIAALAVSSFCVAASLEANRIPMDPKLRYGILDNGLTYYIRHNDVVKERADFYIAQNVGAIERFKKPLITLNALICSLFATTYSPISLAVASGDLRLILSNGNVTNV